MEFFETKWQKADSLDKLLLKNYFLYKSEGIFGYLLVNLSFFYAIGVAFFLNNFVFWIDLIVVFKFMDISMKLYIFQKIDNEGEDVLYEFFPQNISMQELTYLNMSIYVTSMFIALFFS